MAAFRKLALTTVTLAVCGGVATAGALSQPRQLHIVDAPEPRLVALSQPAASHARLYRLKLDGRASARRLFLTVRGAERLVVREGGAVLYRGPAAATLPLGRLAPNGRRALLVELQGARPGPVDVRWTTASV